MAPLGATWDVTPGAFTPPIELHGSAQHGFQ